MNLLVWIISFLIIATKFLDCYTTAIQITSPEQEHNPLARRLMRRFGTQTTIWTIFAYSILIVAVAVWMLFDFFDTAIYKLLYICCGAIIILTQFAVAHTNYTKRLNCFTRLLNNRYGKRKRDA